VELYIVLTVIITSIIQSLFGVGVLLFGTPILLLLGYPFLESLLVLLPISASINLLQVVKDYKSIELKTYKRVIYITVPFIVIFLFIIAKISIDVTFFIGVFLLLISLKDNVNIIKICLDKLLYFDKSYYLFMGIIHGITNLGGALLTAKIFSLELNKYQKRATIAISYMTFAIFQLITILFLEYNFSSYAVFYIALGLGVYLIINKLFFHKISNYKYDKLFAIFLFISGVSLILKGF